jgi:hypothetical protein
MKRSPLKRKTPLKRGNKPMKRSPLRPMSKKRQNALKEYGEVRKRYLEEHPVCEVCGMKPPAEIHHIHNRGTGGALSDTENFLAVCRYCHEQIHAKPQWSRDHGYLI